MRATDLLGSTVFDSDGEPVGAVRDLRLTAGGRIVADSGQPAYRVSALECGPIGIAHRLGYGQRQIKGPWPLTVLLRWMIRRSVLIDWADVIGVHEGRIDIQSRRDQLDSAVRKSP